MSNINEQLNKIKDAQKSNKVTEETANKLISIVNENIFGQFENINDSTLNETGLKIIMELKDFSTVLENIKIKAYKFNPYNNQALKAQTLNEYINLVSVIEKDGNEEKLVSLTDITGMEDKQIENMLLTLNDAEFMQLSKTAKAYYNNWSIKRAENLYNQTKENTQTDTEENTEKFVGSRSTAFKAMMEQRKQARENAQNTNEKISKIGKGSLEYWGMAKISDLTKENNKPSNRTDENVADSSDYDM